MARNHDDDARYPCPACGKKLYGWLAAHHPVDRSKVVLDRCEICGLVVTRHDQPPDTDAELALLEREGNVVVAPNRASFQAAIGGAQWAGLEPEVRRLHLTPDAARRLFTDRGGVRSIRTPPRRAAFGTIWQTFVNGFTYRDNFLRNARRGRLGREQTGTAMFALDSIVSALVALPMAILAAPVELLGVALGRGGELEIELES